MGERGQIGANGFLFILGGIIMSMVLILGYGLVSESSKTATKVQSLQLQTKLAADISLVGNEFGSFKQLAYNFPEDIEQMCVVDLSKKEQILSSKLIEFYPLIKDSLSSDTGVNVFMLGEDFSTLSLPGLTLQDYPYMRCFDKNDGKIELSMEGKGGGDAIVIADITTSTPINDNADTHLTSPDGILSLQIPKGTSATSSQISIGVTSPAEVDVDGAASDVYRLGPSGTTFSEPILLTIKYNPAVVGNCPHLLSSYQFTEEGNLEAVIPAEEIDCDAHRAIFKITGFSYFLLGLEITREAETQLIGTHFTESNEGYIKVKRIMDSDPELEYLIEFPLAPAGIDASPHDYTNRAGGPSWKNPEENSASEGNHYITATDLEGFTEVAGVCTKDLADLSPCIVTSFPYTLSCIDGVCRHDIEVLVGKMTKVVVKYVPDQSSSASTSVQQSATSTSQEK